MLSRLKSSSVAAYYNCFEVIGVNFRFMHTRPKLFMFCLDLKRDNKNCSSIAAYYKCFEVISMNFKVHAQFTTPLQRTITVSRL